jgi:hypothetical protein
VKYQIGDRVWRPTWDASPAYVTCPDCAGSGRIRLIMADETIVSIDCGGCRCGYEPPTGRVKVYDRRPTVEPGEITGIEVEPDGIKYRVSGCYGVREEELSADRDEAMAIATRRAEEFDAEERARIATKEKDTRSWAWNASYHRKCIRDAEKSIAYHKSKLAVAAVKAKEPVT